MRRQWLEILAGAPAAGIPAGELQGIRRARLAWSLRERPVCSLPPTAPTISERRLSLAVWMSSSPGLTVNVPSAHSLAIFDRPSTRVAASSSVRMPACSCVEIGGWQMVMASRYLVAAAGSL